MNILFVVPYAPNLIRVRPYNFIRNLSLRGHQVTVATLWSDEAERSSMEALRPLVHRVVGVRLPRWRSLWNSLAAVPTRKPLQSMYCWQPELARQLRNLVHQDGHFDVAHVEHLRGVQYGLLLSGLKQADGSRLPVVWDSVDSISLLFRQAKVHSRSLFSRMLTWFELGRTERYEGWLVGRFQHVLVTSPVDREAFLSLRRSSMDPGRISVVGNGVDLGYFAPGNPVERDHAELVISGKMSYHANITMALHFADEILPLIWKHNPEVRLVIVGKDPSREVMALARDPRISVTGTVDALPPYLQRATVAVAPIAYGVGIQNKVLEAMACATPVVTTPQAVSALQAVPGKDVLVGESPQAFAEVVIDLLDHPELRREIGAAGRRYVERYHAWPSIAGRLEEVYAQARERELPGE